MAARKSAVLRRGNTNMNFSFDLLSLLENLLKLGIALALALPIAWDREQNTRIMGLRTFPLVAVGSCAYILIGLTFIPADAADAQARVLQGLLGGIGFVGGGAILKSDDRVRGTASAASIWLTGALGTAVAYGYLEIAIILALINFLVLRFLTPFKQDEEE